VSKDLSKEQKKIIDGAKKYHDYIKGVTNPFAIRFLLTFLSGQTKKGYDPAVLFTYFIIFVENVFPQHFRIPETNANLKEFSTKTDVDSNLQVDLGELSSFFTSYVNTQNWTLDLDMGAGLQAASEGGNS
jgi:hypothetical protein